MKTTTTKIDTASSSKSVANTTSGGKSLPAVPALLQTPQEQEEAPFPTSTLQMKEEETTIPPFKLVQTKTNNHLKPGVENIPGFSMNNIANNKTIQRIQHLWMMPATGDPTLDAEVEEAQEKKRQEKTEREERERREEMRRRQEREEREMKKREERETFFTQLLWDRTTVMTINADTEWNHANSSGIHGGAGLTGQKGRAIWLTSRNDRSTALGYGKKAGVLLVYKVRKNLNAAILPAGEQVFPADLIYWQEEFPHIEAVFTDHGAMGELAVFDSANVEYQDTEGI
jgi:hypothetical protein